MTAGNLALTFKFFREDDQSVRICMELSTSTFADTTEEVREDLHELVQEHLELNAGKGKLEEFIEWCSVIPQSAPVDPASILLEQFNLPVGMKDPAETPFGGLACRSLDES